MKQRANQELRDYIQNNDILYWQVAEQIGITTQSFINKLGSPLPETEVTKIKNVVDELKGDK